MLIYGLTIEQWAEMKARHKRMTGEELEPNSGGMLSLRRWWCGHTWPFPGGLRLEGVTVERDDDWSTRAFQNLGHLICYPEKE